MPVVRLPSATRRHVAVLIAALMAALTLTTVASAAADKSFHATVAPGPLVAGASYGVGGRPAIILTITNTSNQAQLGSANVTVPAGILPTAVAVVPGTGEVAGQVLELRSLDLQPLESAVVHVSAQVECASNQAPYTWGFAVKQANDFNGTPGNDLVQDAPVVNTVTGICGITYAAQPRHAEKAPVAITNAIYNPAGAPVAVSVLSGDGGQIVAWWSGTITLTIGDVPAGASPILGGTLTGSAVNGVVTFAPTISASATGYSLDATASATSGTASVGTSTAALESNNFNIVDDATICAASTACEATATGPTTVARVAASSNGLNGDLVILSINDPTVPPPDCAGYGATSELIVFNVTGADGQTPAVGRSKLTTLTLAAIFVTKSASKYQVCYEDDIAPLGPALLPTCVSRNPDPLVPCVKSKALDKAKNLVIVVYSPPGDPKLRL